MSFFRKYWYLFILALITAGLAVATLLTSQKLQEKKPVAPTVPQATPKASQACTVSFNIQAPPATSCSSMLVTERAANGGGYELRVDLDTAPLSYQVTRVEFYYRSPSANSCGTNAASDPTRWILLGSSTTPSRNTNGLPVQYSFIWDNANLAAGNYDIVANVIGAGGASSCSANPGCNAQAGQACACAAGVVACPACRRVVTVTGPGSPTNTPTTTLTSTPTSTLTSTPTLSSTPTPSPTGPLLNCGDSCGVGISGRCPNDHTCSSTTGKCALIACLQGQSCTANQCQILGATNTPTPTSVASCNNSCSVDTNCKTGLVCVGGVCRNPSCTNKTNCNCEIAQATPTPITPKVPVSGNFPAVAGGAVILGGLLLLLGLAL